MTTNNRRGIDPAIIAAVIGVMGTLCVTLISLYANRVLPQPSPQPSLPPQITQPPVTVVEPTWTASPTVTLTNTPVPTNTVPVGEPTSTPGPDTPTPEATLTPAPPAIGSDWANGCISVLWKPYPPSISTTESNGCFLEPVNLFFADDGRLSFTVSGEFDNAEVFGLFAPLPASGTASIQAFLKTLQEGEIWMGVFAEPTIESQGMVIVIPPGEVRRRELIQKTMPRQEEVQRTDTLAQTPPVYNVVFQFGNGSVSTTIMNDTLFNAVPVGTTQQWLFVGYQIRNGRNRIDAEFLNLMVQGQ